MMGSIFPLPRIIYAMAKDGLLFSCLGNVNPRTNVPVIATVVSGVLTAIMALIFNLEQLVEMMSIGTLMSYTLVAISVLLLRYQPRDVGLSKEAAKQFALGPLAEKTGLLGDGNGKSKKYSDTGDGAKTESTADDSGSGATASAGGAGLDDPSATQMDKHLLKKDSDGPDCSLCGSPSIQSYIYVLVSLIALVVIFFSGSALLIFGSELFEFGIVWALILFCVFCTAAVCLVVIIDRQPQNKMELYFKVPFVPYLPVISVFFNIFLTMKLSLPTWIRFFVWLALGKRMQLFFI